MRQSRYPERSRWLHRLPVLAATFVFLISTPYIASAQNWSLGLTAYGEAEKGPQAELLIERQFRPFADLGKWSFAPIVGVRVSENTGSWAGVGIVGSRGFDDGHWRVDAGVMPGYYNQGSDGVDLGSDLEFRTFISLGREMSKGFYVALEVEHMSNAGLAAQNPGDNRLLLRFMKVDLK